MNIVQFIIQGTVIDAKTQLPLLGARIEDPLGNTVTSNSNGIFILSGEYDKDNTESFIISITKPGFSEIKNNILQQDNSLKNDILIQLNTVLSQSNLDSINSLSLSPEQLEKLNSSSQKDIVRIICDKSTNQIKQKLTPLIISQFSVFGITTLSQISPNKSFESYKASCPSNVDELNKIIDKKNKVVKQLNNLFKQIGILQNTLNFSSTIISIVTPLIPVLTNLPAPLPPGVPISVVGRYDDIKDDLKDLLNVFRAKLKGSNLSLDLLQSDFSKILDYLKVLDTLIQGCAQELGADTTTQEEISQNLLNINKEQQPPQQKIVNGFTLEIETENTTNTLKRKRAIGKNNQGVVLLRGEYSYSSSEKILLDELEFQIKSNNLKPD